MTREKPLQALVTAGGTREPIDDVRVIANLSRGRFGAAIAHELVESGISTTLLGSVELLRSRTLIDERLEVVPFDTFGDLDRRLSETLATNPPDIIFMTAAVSDYSPERLPGKLRSHAPTVSLRLTRNPKLLTTLRSRGKADACIVGFKLLSHVGPQELIQSAQRQLVSCQLDLTVANDLAALGGDDHPVTVVSADAPPLDLQGRRETVAAQLVEQVMERWTRRPTPSTPAVTPEPSTAPQDVAANLSAFITDADLTRVKDAAGSSWLLERLPNLEAAVMLRDALVLHDVTPTTIPTTAQEAFDQLNQAVVAGRHPGNDFALPLSDNRTLLGLGAGATVRLRDEWRTTKQDFERFLERSGMAPGASSLEMSPILLGPQIVGALASDSLDKWCVPYLLPRHRKLGLGDWLSEALDQRGAQLGIHDVFRPTVDFWLERGWRPLDMDQPVIVLDPPSSREDLRPASSACLFEPAHRQVLLGRRTRGPWVGHWAFPGGAVMPDETTDAAAIRELQEETGLAPPISVPFQRHEVAVGIPGGGGFSVSCCVFITRDLATPSRSVEMEARWLPLEAALRQRPITAGTLRVLRKLSEH